GRHVINVVITFSVRVKDDAGSVRRPKWSAFACRTGRQACEQAARDVHDPDIAIAVDRPVYCDALAVGREFRVPEHGVIRFTNLAKSFARPVEPGELPSCARSARAIGNAYD